LQKLSKVYQNTGILVQYLFLIPFILRARDSGSTVSAMRAPTDVKANPILNPNAIANVMKWPTVRDTPKPAIAIAKTIIPRNAG